MELLDSARHRVGDHVVLPLPFGQVTEHIEHEVVAVVYGSSAPHASWRNKLMDVDGEVDNARARATCGHGLLRRREVEDAAPPLLSDAPCFVTGK
uniref:Uncharacterized protein n=1 Tax=Oryza nivara TaxID=4536 RepID=A0A0E0HAA6_ORYNI